MEVLVRQPMRIERPRIGQPAAIHHGRAETDEDSAALGHRDLARCSRRDHGRAYGDARQNRREGIEAQRLEDVASEQVVVVAPRGLLSAGQCRRAPQKLFQRLRHHHWRLRRPPTMKPIRALRIWPSSKPSVLRACSSRQRPSTSSWRSAGGAARFDQRLDVVAQGGRDPVDLGAQCGIIAGIRRTGTRTAESPKPAGPRREARIRRNSRTAPRRWSAAPAHRRPPARPRRRRRSRRRVSRPPGQAPGDVVGPHHQAHRRGVSRGTRAYRPAKEERMVAHDDVELGRVGHPKRRVVQENLPDIVVARHDHELARARESARSCAEGERRTARAPSPRSSARP